MLNMRTDKRKRYAVRVRTGCITCKIRRVKCDETKPTCMKCAQTGRKCDGYSLVSPRSKAPERAPKKKKPDAGSKCVAKVPLETNSFYSLPFKIPGSQSDRQLFHYFCVHTATDLAGFSYGSSDFWSQLVLQCSHHEPVVRCALIAVAAVHRNFVTEEEESAALVNPLEEYNKAIRRLRRYLESQRTPDPKVVILCCALFYCFDSTRGEQKWALSHLQTALDILKGWTSAEEAARRNLGSPSVDEIDIMVEFFSRLDIQASVYGNDRSPSLLLVTREEQSGLASCVPSRFWNFSEAETALGKLENWILHFLTAKETLKGQAEVDLPSAVAQEVRELRTQSKRWDEAFETLVDQQDFSSSKAKTRTFQNRVSMLKVEFGCYSIALVEFCPTSKDDLIVAHKEGFPAIMEEIEAIIYRESLDTNPALRGFSCDIGVVMALSYVGYKDRNARGRERALLLLEGRTRREGLWDSQMMASIARNIMELELNGAKFPTDGEGQNVEDWGVGLAEFASYHEGFHDMAEALGVPKYDQKQV